MFIRRAIETEKWKLVIGLVEFWNYEVDEGVTRKAEIDLIRRSPQSS